MQLGTQSSETLKQAFVLNWSPWQNVKQEVLNIRRTELALRSDYPMIVGVIESRWKQQIKEAHSCNSCGRVWTLQIGMPPARRWRLSLHKSYLSGQRQFEFQGSTERGNVTKCGGGGGQEHVTAQWPSAKIRAFWRPQRGTSMLSSISTSHYLHTSQNQL